MVNEYWINDQADWNEFITFLNGKEILSSNLKRTAKDYIYEENDLIVHIPEKYINTLNLKSKYDLPQKKVITPTKEVNKYDSLIFGKDSTEKITNITVSSGKVQIYKSDGSLTEKEYQNWALGSSWTEGAKKLKGYQYFQYIKDLNNEQWDYLRNNWNPSIWTPRTDSEGFMLCSGMTYYKGMKVSDVSLLSFDIEATTLDKNDPEALVVLLSATYRDRQGKTDKKIFDIFDFNEECNKFWDSINKYVVEKDPDIILGHNILSYDLPYSAIQADKLKWGKNSSPIEFETKASRIRKDAQQQYEFFNAKVPGREIIDTFFLSLKYDIARDFPSYGLKAIEKYLNLVEDDRSWDFIKWPVKKLLQARRNGNTEIWEKFKQYCQDDSDSPIKMFDIMIPSFFYLCQSVPKTLQQMINEASGSQLDSLMVRSYLQDGYSLPKSSKKEEFEGAISMGIPGVYKNVRKVDVASLYPSIMLQYEIYDKKKDPNRNMLKMLEYFRNERLTNKKLAKETGDKYYDDLQNSQKIMINSMYGFMGANYLLFNYPKGASEVTKKGREILLKGVEWATGHTLEKVVKSITNEGTDEAEEKYHWILGKKISDGRGYTLVNVDTDSFSYSNNNAPTKEEFKNEINDLNSLYPELIKWEDDGVYEQIIVVKAKNYVLVKDGKRKYKGSSLTDQKKEPRLTRLLEDLINVLLNESNDVESKLITVYNNCCKEVLVNFQVKDWVTKKTVTESVLKGERLNEQKILNACKEAISHNMIDGIQAGDKIYLYQALNGVIQKIEKGELVFLKNGTPKMVENCILKFPELYNNDHDQWYYVKRVHDTLMILKNVIDVEKFTKYFLKKKQDLLVNYESN